MVEKRKTSPGAVIVSSYSAYVFWTDFFLIKPTDALISQIYFVKKLYMFRAVPLPIIRSLFNVHSALVYSMSYRFDDSFQARPGRG